MYRRLRAASALAVVTLAAAAACGGSSDNGGSGSSPSADTGALPNLDGTSVTVIGKWSGVEQKSFKKVLDNFETETGATVKFTSAGDNTPTVIGTRVAQGNPPDVAILPQPGLLTQLASSGDLIALPDDIAQTVRDSYSQPWQDLGSAGGKLYGVWFKAANKSTIWYRTGAFKTAGITEPPATWDEFVADLGTLRDSGVDGPLALGAADGWTLTDLFENIYLRSAGVEKYDQLTKHEIKWTDPTVKVALTLMSKLFKQKDLIQPNGLQTTFADSVVAVFGNKKGAVNIEGDFAATDITNSTDAKPGVDAKFFAFPSINGSEPAVVGGGDVAVIMKDNEGARALMQYLASADSAQIWAGLGGFTSANSNVSLDAYPDDVARESADQLVKAQIFRFDMSDLEPADFGGTPGQGEWKDLQDFLSNPSNVDGTAKKLEQHAAAAYK
jgi:ABC-type glycerol-3-phosphate transport system substrate-binding protein